MARWAPFSKPFGVITRAVLVAAVAVALAPVTARSNGHDDGPFMYATQCNQEVQGKVMLKQDLTCNDSDGLIVVAHLTKIFMNGFSIRCMGDPAAYKSSCQGGDPNNLDTGGLPSTTLRDRCRRRT
jgi:hypothetical protein